MIMLQEFALTSLDNNRNGRGETEVQKGEQSVSHQYGMIDQAAGHVPAEGVAGAVS
jgi:hypothetical protein